MATSGIFLDLKKKFIKVKHFKEIIGLLNFLNFFLSKINVNLGLKEMDRKE